MRKATSAYYETDTVGVVREVRERAIDESGWSKRHTTEEFYVLQSDFEASPTETFTRGDYSRQYRIHMNDHALTDVTLAYLTDKRISAQDAVVLVATQDTTAAGLAVAAICQRKAEVKNLIIAIGHEFDARGGWTRYWLVTSSAGHIHSNTSCHTCNKGRSATTFALVYHLSGETAPRAVEVFGPALCSFCYPDAPVEMTEQAKVTTGLASAYFDGGYEGWLAAKAKAEARKAKKEAKG
jgi:hypothetical protein